MPVRKHVNINETIRNNDLITEAIRRGAREAMRRHIQAGVPMVSCEEGKVVEITPEELARILESDTPDDS
ncbi:MAG: hypothetical protein LBQ79_03930 [Deltaproteobacteria bacterium]|nr:hypothetical protein [Deltaproteobacteria bacterium]